MTLEEIVGRVAQTSARPKTLLLNALNGTCALPERIERAGGTPCDSLDDAPEVLLIALPGKTLDEAEDEAYDLAETPGWWELPCVRGGDCYLIDAAQLDADEAQALWILATVLHPDVFTEMLPPYCVRMLPKDLYEKPDDADG